MGCGKPNDEGNQLVPLKRTGELELTGKESEASDSCQISHVNNTSASAFMPIALASVPNSHWENAQGMHQSCAQDSRIVNSMPGLIMSQDAQSEHSVIDRRGNLRNQYTRLSRLNPQLNMNFVPNPSMTPGGYYINAHVGEGKASDMNRSQSTRDTFVNNNVRSGASYPGKIDGSFLTLGIGGDMESRTKNKFSSREIAGHLKESCNFPAAHISPSFQTSDHNLTGPSSFQSSPAGFPASMYNSLGAFSSHTFQSSHMPEAFKQYDFFESNGRDLGIASKSPGTYLADAHYNHYQGDLAPTLLPFSNPITSTSDPGFSGFSNMTSESAKFIETTFQSTQGQPQNYHARSVMGPTSSFGGVTANPVTQDYLGKLIPALQGSRTQVIGGGSSMNVQPIGNISSTVGVNSVTHPGITTFPGKTLTQIAEAAVGPFPRRLGVQPDGTPQSVNQGMNPRVMGVQTRSKGGVNQPQSVQLAKSLQGTPPCMGNPQDTLQHQLNVQAPLFSSGPASHNAKVDQPSQISNAAGHPSLKREAAGPPPVASWGRRRKLIHPSTAQNLTYQRQGTAATVLRTVPSEIPHIRWQGFDKIPEPLGHKCLLCNRDLSFTPDGPVYQPSMPPAVAVLPCSHTFHDHCLRLITPEDQIKNPPCIPCAMGEAS